ncbi:hypothetical protein VKT23_011061 [Stygiomarasmius scandens]|uniref:Cytochrome P450 n=1 Tax=Marasmiellus scandens TaxID=2682957 RepID=A0ABR1JAP1_9AGAR
MGFITSFLSIPLFLAFAYLLYANIIQRRFRPRLPFPPGPKGLPIVGNLFNTIDTNDKPQPQWIQYLVLGKKYDSDIIHINVLGDHTVVLNSIKHTSELLEKRSALYSGRPAMPMHRDLIGLHRRTFHQHFQARVIETYHPVIRQLTSVALRKLIRTENEEGQIPDVEFNELFLAAQQHAGAVILRVTYGITAPEETDYYSELAHIAADSYLASANHGSFLVDHAPWLKYVPAWFPGASFRSKAKSWAPSTSRLLNEPWEKLKASMNSGDALPCFATKNLQKFNITPGLDPTYSKGEINMEEVIKNVSGIAYLGE